MWDLYVMFGLFLAVIVGLGVAAGWHLNFVALCLCTGIYIGIMLRSDWPEFFAKRDRNYLDYGGLIVPLLPLAAAWLTAAYVRGLLDPANTESLHALLRQWFLR